MYARHQLYPTAYPPITASSALLLHCSLFVYVQVATLFAAFVWQMYAIATGFTSQQLVARMRRRQHSLWHVNDEDNMTVAQRFTVGQRHIYAQLPLFCVLQHVFGAYWMVNFVVPLVCIEHGHGRARKQQ